MLVLYTPAFICSILGVTTDHLGRDRRFLKLAKMTLVSCATGETVEPKIRKRVLLPSPNQNFSVVLATVKDSSHTPSGSSTHNHSRDAEQREELTTGIMSNSSIDTMDILKEQRRDIDRILTNVKGLQDQMQEMENSIESLRAHKNPSHLGHASPNDHGFTKEIELLTESVCDMSNKVHQIDGLNLELKLMKRRIQRLEEGNMSTQSSYTVTGLSQDTPRAKFARMTGSLARRPLSSAGGAPRPYKNADLVELSVPKDGTESSPGLAALDNKDKPVQQAFPIMSKTANRNFEPSSVPMHQQDLEQDELNGGRDDIVTAAVPVKPLATLKQRASIPETDVASPIISSSSSRPSPIQFRPPSKPTTPETRTDKEKPVSATSLNNHQFVPVSDTEDDDYDPEPYPNKTPPKGGTQGNNRTRGSGRRPRHAVPVKLSTPEWEKPGWSGPATTTPSTTKGRGIVRRSVGGSNFNGEPDAKRRKTTLNDERRVRDSIPNDPSTAVSVSVGMQHERRSYSSRARNVVDLRHFKGARDEQGRLLRPDGRIDKRSIRYWKNSNDKETESRAASEHGNEDAASEAGKQAEMGNGNNATPSESENLAQHQPRKQRKGARKTEGFPSKPRDVEGYLLKPDGTRDGRSILNRAQYLKPKASRENIAS